MTNKISCFRTTSNCGMYELFGFSGNNTKAVANNEWFTALAARFGVSGNIPAIVLFSGVDYQEGYNFSPQNFAKWLVKLGERVVKTGKVLNTSSENKIQAFLWSPSAAFKRRYERFYNTLSVSDTSDL